MIIQFFVRSIYASFRLIALAYQRIYFPITKVNNKEGLDVNGAAIIVSNHPNTLLDPLHVLSRTPRRASLLANASMFKHPLANWFLNYFTIPIHRPGRDDTSRKINNGESFTRAYHHLIKGGLIYIAPEGSSDMERHLRPVKTGTARIALGAAAKNDFKLALKIVPVGLNYEHPSQCGSRLLINVGEVVDTSKWYDAYKNDPKNAVENLTAELEQQMQLLLIHTEDKAQDQLLYRLESILQNDEPFGVNEHYGRVQQLLFGLQKLKRDHLTNYEILENKTETYRLLLKENKLTDHGIANREKNIFSLWSVLGFPIWLYGYVNNWLAKEIPRWLVRKLDLYVGYSSTVKILSSLFTFPVFYFLQYKLVSCFFGRKIGLVYLLSLPVSAVFSWLYKVYMGKRVEAVRFRRLERKHTRLAIDILGKRKELKEGVLGLIR